METLFKWIGVACFCFLFFGAILGTRTVSGPSKEQEYLSLIETKAGQVVADGKYVTLNGTIKNLGTRTLSYWELKINLIDKTGAVIDSDMANSTNLLNPGESKKFDVMVENDRRIKSWQIVPVKVSFDR